MDFKKGDKVRVLDNRDMVHGKRQFIGMITYVTSLYMGDYPTLNCDTGYYFWVDGELEKVKG